MAGPSPRRHQSGQAAAVYGICGEGRRVSLVLGVAGAGKTTAVRCVADAYATAGYEVVGTATSGQAGDWIVTLAPGTDGQTVTSERGVVDSVDIRQRSLVARMDDGRLERLAGRDVDADRLTHGYAVTVHRAQASTVDVAHRLEDGGAGASPTSP